MKKFVCSLFIVLNIFCISISAQTELQPQSYMAGESLTYEAKFSKIIKGITIADLSFAVERAENNRDYLITSDAVTKGSLLKLFKQRFVQKIRINC